MDAELRGDALLRPALSALGLVVGGDHITSRVEPSARGRSLPRCRARCWR
jgi:hypothetical protein